MGICRSSYVHLNTLFVARNGTFGVIWNFLTQRTESSEGQVEVCPIRSVSYAVRLCASSDGLNSLIIMSDL